MLSRGRRLAGFPTRTLLALISWLCNWRFRWILGLVFAFGAGFIRHYFQWIVPLDTIERTLVSNLSWLKLGPLSAYHLLFTIPIFASVALLTLPLRRGPLPLILFEYFSWSAVIFSIEDASWFIAWMSKGGRWIQPGDWTCRIAGCLRVGVAIPLYYIYSAVLLAASIVALRLGERLQRVGSQL